MGLALEEPREDDVRFEVDGLPMAAPPDVEAILKAYDGAVLDRDPGWGGGDRFFVHFGRRRWGC